MQVRNQDKLTNDNEHNLQRAKTIEENHKINIQRQFL